MATTTRVLKGSVGRSSELSIIPSTRQRSRRRIRRCRPSIIIVFRFCQSLEPAKFAWTARPCRYESPRGMAIDTRKGMKKLVFRTSRGLALLLRGRCRLTTSSAGRCCACPTTPFPRPRRPRTRRRGDLASPARAPRRRFGCRMPRRRASNELAPTARTADPSAPIWPMGRVGQAIIPRTRIRQ